MPYKPGDRPNRHAPLLDRETLQDRALARELDFDSREPELRQTRA